MKKEYSLTMRGVLKHIKDVMKPNGKEGEKVWDVISALRGPDDEDYIKKGKTTAVIRNKALGNIDYISVAVNTEDNFVEVVDGYDHFYNHIKEAAKALGIEIRCMKEDK